MLSRHSLLPFVVVITALSSRATADVILMIDHGGHRIKNLETDGSNLCEFSPRFVYPQGIAVDNQSRTYFWSIGRWIFKEDFGPATASFGIDTGESVVDCDLDWINQKIYWGDNDVVDGQLTGAIRRCNLDFSNVETVVTGVAPLHLALDPANNHVYWTDRVAGNRILRVNSDGSQLTEIVVVDLGYPASLVHRGRGISLDLINRKLYWTEHSRGVFRANLDGTDIEEIVDVVVPKAIVVDDARARIIFTGAIGDTGYGFVTANLDGSNVQGSMVATGYASDWDFADIDPSIYGDINWDNQIDLDDLMPFVDALINPDAIECNRQRADINGDGATNGLDVSQFVNCLLNSCI